MRHQQVDRNGVGPAVDRAPVRTLPKNAAWSVVLLVLGGVGFTLVSEPYSSTMPGSLLYAAAFVSLALIGAAVVARAGHGVGWLLLVVALMGMLNGVGQAAAIILHESGPSSLPEAQLVLGAAGIAWAGAMSSIAALLLVFPTGRLRSARWRAAVWLVAATAALGLTVTVAISRYVLDVPAFIKSVWSLEFAGGPVPRWIEVGGNLLIVLTALSFGAGVAALIARLRWSEGQERQQVKWVLYAAGLLVLTLPLAIVESIPSFVNIVAGGVLVAALAAAFGIALLRHNLYDIDRVINRTVVYVVVVVLLGGLYLGGVFMFRKLLGLGDNDLAVAASTLAAVGLFNPLRVRVQSWVNRTFYRTSYDEAVVMERFSRRLRRRVALDEVSEDLLVAVDETLRPSDVAIWIAPVTETVEV